jgi:hypothetical protein
VEPIRIPLELIDKTAAALEQMQRRFAALEEKAKAIGQSFAQLPQSGGSGGGLAGLGGQADSLFGKLSGVSFGFNNIVGAVQTLAAAAKPAFDFLIGSNEKLNAQLLSSQTNLASSARIFQGGKELTDPTAKIQASQGALRAALKQVEVDTQSLVGVTSAQVNELFQTTLQNAAALNNQSKQFPDPIAAATSLTKGWAASLKVIGIPLNQAGQEINSILRGQVDQNSLLAKNLNISNEQVNKWKSQGILVDELNKRLNVFVAGNAIASRSIEGISSNIQDIVEILGREVGAPFLEPIVDILDQLYQALNANREGILEFAKSISAQVLVIFNQIKAAIEPLIPGLLLLGQGFASLAQAGIEAFISTVQTLLSVLGAATQIFGPVVTLIGGLVKVIGDFAKSDLGQIVIQVGLLIAAAAVIGPIIGSIGAAIGGLVAAIPVFVAGLGGVIASALAAAAPVLAIGAAIAALGFILYQLAPAFKPLIDGIQDFFGRLGAVFSPLVEDIKKSAGEIGAFLAAAFAKIGPIIQGLINLYIKNLQTTIAFLKPLGAFIADVFIKGTEFAVNFARNAIAAIGALVKAVADSPIGKIIGALLDQLGKLAPAVEQKPAAPDFGEAGAAYIELGEKVKGALAELAQAGDPKSATAAAEKLIAITKDQIAKGVITVEQGQKQLSAILGNDTIDKSVRQQAQSLSQGLAANGAQADELAKKAQGAAGELQKSAQAFADFDKATKDATATLSKDVVDPVQAKAAGDAIVKATQAAFEGKVITAEQARQKLDAVLNNPNVDKAIKDKAGALKADIDKAAASGQAATDQQVQAIQKAGAAIAQNSGDFQIKGKTVDNLGTSFEQLAKKAANAQKSINEEGGGDPARFAASLKELTDITKQQLEAGQITEAEAKKRLTAIATNKKAEVAVQQAAQKELEAIREAGAKRESEGFDRQIQNVEESVAKGKKTKIEAEEEITKLKFQQQNKQLENLKASLKAEQAAGRGNGKRANDLKNQIEKAETDVSKTEENARKQRFDNRLKLQEDASKKEVANIKERIAQESLSEAEGERQLNQQKAKSTSDRLKILQQNLQDEIKAGRGKGELAKGLREQVEQAETEAAEAAKAVRDAAFKRKLEDFDEQQRILDGRKATGQVSEAEANRDTLAIGEAKINIELAEINRKRSLLRSDDKEGLEALEAQEADIYKRRQENLKKFQDEQIRLLEQAQKRASDALKLAQTQQETELAKLERDGLARSVELDDDRAKLKEKQLKQELQQEKERLRALEALPKLSDPAREEERQSKIRASRQRTAEITLSQVQAEAATQDAIAAKLKDRIDQQIKGVENLATANQQASDRALKLQEFQEKAIDRQNKLLQARKGLFDALKGYTEGEYNLALQFTEGEENQQKIREEAARQRLRFLKQEQEFELQSLELELKKNEALRQREIIQNRIEKSRAQADLAKESANTEKARVDLSRGKITQAEFQAQLLAESAAKERVRGVIEQGALLQEQATTDREAEALQRQGLAKRQALATDQARAEVAKETKTKSDDLALQREFLAKARNGAREVIKVPITVDLPPIVAPNAIARDVAAATDTKTLVNTLKQFEATVIEGVGQLIKKPAPAGTIKQENTITVDSKPSAQNLTQQLYNGLYDLSQFAKTSAT